MINNRIHLMLFSLIFLVSCFSEQKKNAAAIVAKTWQAEKSTIEASMAADSKKGVAERIELTLINLKAIGPEYSHKKVTSTSALLFLRNLDSSNYKDNQEINIVVENYGEKYEKAYLVRSLKTANKLLPLVDAFFDALEEKSTDKFLEAIDSNFMNDSIALYIYSGLQQIESELGKMSERRITGFDFDKIQETDTPVLVVWAETSNATAHTEYRFFFSLQSGKIVFVGINESV